MVARQFITMLPCKQLTHGTVVLENNLKGENFHFDPFMFWRCVLTNVALSSRSNNTAMAFPFVVFDPNSVVASGTHDQ